MVTQRKEPPKPSSLGTLSTTECINVTDMTPSQQRKLFVVCMNQEGFRGFTKNGMDKQTYFIFRYANQ